MTARVYPRVLVVGIDPLMTNSGQGITISNLFGGWDSESLGQVFVTEAAPDPALCAHSHRLPPRTFPADHVFRGPLGKVIRVNHPLTQKFSAIEADPDVMRGLRVRLHLTLRALSDLGPVRLTAQTQHWVKAFRPELVYSCLGNLRLIRLATAISDAAGEIPVVPHFMDDWPSTLYANGRMGGLPYRTVQRELRRLFSRVPLGFCIGTHMATEYALRYGIDFHDFMNCVPDSAFTPLTTPRSNPQLVWSYVGGLHLNRWKPLLMLAQSIANRDGLLNIFAPPSDIKEHAPKFTGFPGTRLGSLAPQDVMVPMHESDVLLHVESFEPAESAYTRLSVSTKLAQYISAGKPILGFGPGDLASMRVIAEAGVGIVVAVERQEEVDAAVDSITKDPAFRLACGDRGVAFSSVHFKQSVVCERFRQRLTEAAGMTATSPSSAEGQ